MKNPEVLSYQQVMDYSFRFAPFRMTVIRTALNTILFCNPVNPLNSVQIPVSLTNS